MLGKKLIETANVECMGVRGINEFKLEYYLTSAEDGIYGVEIVKKQETFPCYLIHIPENLCRPRQKSE